jgi:leader peptidase (prepilin peptidase)/N-methyltransferase
MGYFFVELFTGLAFLGLLYLLLFVNVRDFAHVVPAFRELHFTFGPVVIFLHHVTLFSFLLVASLCDLRDMEIPLSVTVTGTLVGLVFAVLCPWPYPETFVPAAVRPTPFVLQLAQAPPTPGVYPWPVWYPLPAWLPPGCPLQGLATGVAGAVAGMLVLRGVRFLFGLGRGLEGLGVGDADLMMMAGAFIGWQPVVLAFFASVFPALLFAVVHLFRKGEQPLPFGPPLSLGVVITLLAWPVIAPRVKELFFDPIFLLIVVVMGGIILFVTAFLLRLLRGSEPISEES